ETIGSVWYRRPGRPQTTVRDRQANVFAASESEAALGNLWRAIDCLWVSRPEAIRAATPRFAQLTAAAHFGLSVPSTLITNDPLAATEFAKHHSLVAKPVGTGLVSGENGRGIYANRLVGAVAWTEAVDHASVCLL